MRIEDLVKKDKSKLDLDEVPQDAWEQIRNEWKKDQSGSGFSNWWKVAAIMFISTSIGLLVYTSSLQKEVDRLASLGDISNEYKKIEDDYIKEIQTLESNIEVNQVSQNDDFAWLLEEMQALEEINLIYRQDIGTVADQNLLVDALIDYYEKKIKLLKKLELEMNRAKKYIENEKDNTGDVSI